MTKYRAKTALSIALDPKKPNRTTLVRVGDEVELTDEQAEGLRKVGVLVEEGDDAPDPTATASAVASEESGEPTPLPDRPSNGASKDTWRTYLEQLKAVTDPEMDEPLEIPVDATRDQMIQIADTRVREFNEGE